MWRGQSHLGNKLPNLREYGSTLQTAGVAASFQIQDGFWEGRRHGVGLRSPMYLTQRT